MMLAPSIPHVQVSTPLVAWNDAAVPPGMYAHAPVDNRLADSRRHSSPGAQRCGVAGGEDGEEPGDAAAGKANRCPNERRRAILLFGQRSDGNLFVDRSHRVHKRAHSVFELPAHSHSSAPASAPFWRRSAVNAPRRGGRGERVRVDDGEAWRGCQI